MAVVNMLLPSALTHVCHTSHAIQRTHYFNKPVSNTLFNYSTLHGLNTLQKQAPQCSSSSLCSLPAPILEPPVLCLVFHTLNFCSQMPCTDGFACGIADLQTSETSGLRVSLFIYITTNFWQRITLMQTQQEPRIPAMGKKRGLVCLQLLDQQAGEDNIQL